VAASSLGIRRDFEARIANIRAVAPDATHSFSFALTRRRPPPSHASPGKVLDHSLMQIRRTFRAFVVLSLIAGFVTVAPLGAQDTTTATASHFTLSPVDIHGFVQVYYRDGDPTTPDGFRLRKADIKLSGLLSPHLSWRVVVDAAKALSLNATDAKGADSNVLAAVSIDQKSRILLDAALTYTVNKDLNFDVGQQNLPLSEEGWISLSQLETIERSMFIVDKTRAEGLGFVFDVGASANGMLGNVLEYHTGVFNEPGDDQGTTDSNDQKAFMGRFVVHPPFLPKLQFGGSGTYEGGPALQHRERGGGEAQYKDDFFTVRAEAMGARDGLLHRFGWYGLGAVRPATHLQFVARYDSWDRDLSAETTFNNSYERQELVGGSYVLDGSAASKLAINLVRQSFPGISTVRAATFVLIAFQGSW
jgi:hypothetical protein